jgi:hypothetical protein
MERKESAHFAIESEWPAPFADAILKIYETTLDGYKEIFGIDLFRKAQRRKFKVFARIDPSRPQTTYIRLEVTPPEIHIIQQSEAELNPPGQGGPHHIHGFPHELGHFMIELDSNLLSEGLAFYFGCEVTDYVHRKLGDSAWPRPYNSAKLDGMEWLRSWGKMPDPGPRGAFIDGAVLLTSIADEYGQKVIGDAIKRVLSTEKPIAFPAKDRWDGKVLKVYRLIAFEQALVDITGDRNIETMFKERGFGAKLNPENVTSAELWACKDKDARDRLLDARWGSATAGGILDGKPVQPILVNRLLKKGTWIWNLTGLRLEMASDGWTSIYWQPATKRTYVFGRVRVAPPGTKDEKDIGEFVENDAIGPDGMSLHLNPNAPPPQ